MKRNQVVITALAVMLAVAGYLTYAGKQDLNRLNQAQTAVLPSKAYDTYVAGTGTDEGQELADEDSLTGSGEGAAADAENTGAGSAVPAGGDRVVSSGTEDAAADAAGEDGNQAPEASATLSADQSNLTEIDSLDYDIVNPGEAVLTNGLTVSDYLASARLSREQVRGKNREDLLKVIDDDGTDTAMRQAAVDKMVELTDNSDKECAAETLLCAKGFDNSIVSITDGKVDVVICRAQLTDAELAQIEDIVKRKTDVSAADIVISLMDVTQ